MHRVGFAPQRFLPVGCVFLFAGGLVGPSVVHAAQLSAPVNQQVTVVGWLELSGTNYFKDPRFAIVDDQGNRVPVTIWRPLEVPPPMPNAPATSRPETMADYLGKRVSVTGVVRAVAASSVVARLSPTGPSGGSYVEVQSAEIVTDANAPPRPAARNPGVTPAGQATPATGPAPAPSPLPPTPTAPPIPIGSAPPK